MAKPKKSTLQSNKRRKGQRRSERREYQSFVASLPLERQEVHVNALLAWLSWLIARQEK